MKSEPSIRKSARSVLVLALSCLLATPAVVRAQEEAPPQILFTNVNVFDGYAESLQDGMNVLVEGKLIKTISASAIDAMGRV